MDRSDNAASTQARAGGMVAFVKQGTFSNSSHHILQQLQSHFGEYRFVTFDVGQALLGNHRKLSLWLGMFHAYRLYGSQIRSGRFTRWHWIYQTPYMFRRVRRYIQGRLGPLRDQLAFSFQLQSLFDGGLPDVPNFLYTDHTHLANRDYPDFRETDLAVPAWLELERSVYHRARRVLTMSEHIRQSVITQYGVAAPNVVCVSTGGNVRVAEAPPRQPTGTPSPVTVLFVGSEWERKGGPDLLKAFTNVRQQNPDVRLRIVGPPPDIGDIPGVERVGRVSLEQLAECYRQADIFCLPTHREPFGYVFLEAARYRLPVIGTRIGALPEFIEDGQTGYLVTPGDTTALAARLTALLQNPALRAEFGNRLHDRVCRDYTWDVFGRNTERAIRDALGLGTSAAS